MSNPRSFPGGPLSWLALGAALLALGCGPELASDTDAGSSGGGGSGSSTSSSGGSGSSGGALDGARLYASKCARCHDDLATSEYRGATATQIRNEHGDLVSAAEAAAIASALSSGGSSSGSGSSSSSSSSGTSTSSGGSSGTSTSSGGSSGTSSSSGGSSGTSTSSSGSSGTSSSSGSSGTSTSSGGSSGTSTSSGGSSGTSSSSGGSSGTSTSSSSSGASSGGSCASSSGSTSAEPAGLPVPPQGFDARSGSIPHGTVSASVSYPTRSHGQRKVTIYTPPGYSTSQKYPVLYLHHGIGGNEVSWIGQGSNEGNADNVMDYLYSKQLATPMIVVMPDGNVRDASDGFGAHEDVLINDLIPWVEKTYSVQADADHRAIAGLSMGGGQTFNFGFPHTDVFHHIGPYSAAPNTRPPSQTIKDVATVKQNVKVVFISCGSTDGLIGNSKTYHDFLVQNGIPHLYQVEPNQGHNKTVWNRSLYNFAQRIFKACP